MWDRQSESWWQQFMEKAIIGEMTDKILTIIPPKIKTFACFKKRTNNDATILVINVANYRDYGNNPYVGYDSGNHFYIKARHQKTLNR